MSVFKSSSTKKQFSKSTSSSSIPQSAIKDSKCYFTKNQELNKDKDKDKAKYKHRSRSNSPPKISPTLSTKFTFSLSSTSTTETSDKVQPAILINTELETNNNIVLQDIPEVKIETNNVNTVSETNTILKNNTINLYNATFYIINTLKSLVFQNYAFISGDFNSHQFIIDKNIDIFTSLIVNYEKNHNIKLIKEDIFKLFIDESCFPETNKRLQLQKSIDILINKNNFTTFITQFKSYFSNNNYKINYENKGNFKNSSFKNNILFEVDIEIYLDIIIISDLINNISFKINLIIMENKRK